MSAAIAFLEKFDSSDWRELTRMNHPTTGDTYIVWISQDTADNKPIYQVTTGRKPPAFDSGYYDLKALLKLKGL